MTTLETLRSAARDAINARNAIERPTSPEWLAAHRKATEACLARDAEIARLAKADRYGAWRNNTDKYLMHLGLL
jgi:DNA-binding FadR family transcriptional regulator